MEGEQRNHQFSSGFRPTVPRSQSQHQDQQNAIESIGRPWLVSDAESQAQAHAPAPKGIIHDISTNISEKTTTDSIHHRPLIPSAHSPSSSNTTTPRYESFHAKMDVDSNSTDDRARRGTSVLSMDDIEAAQALEGLRSGKYLDFIFSLFIMRASLGC